MAVLDTVIRCCRYNWSTNGTETRMKAVVEMYTVLQNRVNPKSNAPEISKGSTKLERNFQYKSKSSQKLNDVRLWKVTFKVNLLWRTSNNHKYRPLKIMLQNIWRHFCNHLFMSVQHVFSVFQFIDVQLRYRKSFSYKKPTFCLVY